jgi:hypothetical protein
MIDIVWQIVNVVALFGWLLGGVALLIVLLKKLFKK